MSWKPEAKRLFFDSKQPIVSISVALGKSRQAVGDYLKLCEGFREEKERRKAENAAARKDYKREWEQDNRPSRAQTGILCDDEKELLRREHDTAVRILSQERFFYE